MTRNLVLLSKTVAKKNLSSIIQNFHVEFAKVATSQANSQIFQEIPTCIAILIKIEMK